MSFPFKIWHLFQVRAVCFREGINGSKIQAWDTLTLKKRWWMGCLQGSTPATREEWQEMWFIQCEKNKDTVTVRTVFVFVICHLLSFHVFTKRRYEYDQMILWSWFKLRSHGQVDLPFCFHQGSRDQMAQKSRIVAGEAPKVESVLTFSAWKTTDPKQS